MSTSSIGTAAVSSAAKFPAADHSSQEFRAEVEALRSRVAAWVLGGEGPMLSLPDVLDELCRILSTTGEGSVAEEKPALSQSGTSPDEPINLMDLCESVIRQRNDALADVAECRKALAQIKIDIDSFDKGGAFKKLRSYDRLVELITSGGIQLDEVILVSEFVDRKAYKLIVSEPCSECDPDLWKRCSESSKEIGAKGGICEAEIKRRSDA